MELRAQNTPLQKQHQVIINHTEQVQLTTEVRVVAVLREATEHRPLLQSQVIVLLRKVAVAATEAVEVVAEAAAPRIREVLVAQEVPVVRVVRAAEVVVEVHGHLRAEDN